MEWEGMAGGRAPQLQHTRTQRGYHENQGQTVHRIEKGDRQNQTCKHIHRGGDYELICRLSLKRMRGLLAACI